MKKFVSDSVFITVGGLVNRVKGFLFIPLIIVYIGLEGYGAYTQIIITTLLLKAVFSLELGSGFQRFIPAENDRNTRALHFGSVLYPTLLLGILGSLFLLGSAGWLSRLFFENQYQEALMVSSPLLLSGVLYANGSKFLLAEKRFKTYTLLTFCYDLLPYLGFIGGIMLSRDVYYGMLVYLAMDMVVALAILGVILSRLPLARFSWNLFRQYVRYTYALSLSSIEGGLLDKVDRYFIGFFLGVESLGIYNVVYKICSVSDFITVPIKKQLMSYLSGAWDRGHERESRLVIQQALLLFMILSIALVSFLTINIHDIFALVLQEDPQTLPLPWIVLFIGLGITAYASKRFYSLLIYLRQHTLDELRYQTVGLILNVMLNTALIPPLGLLGAAIATFISYAVMIIMVQMRYRLALSWAFWGHICTFTLLATGIMLLGHYAFGGKTLWWLGLNGLVSAVVYFGLILLLKKALLVDIQQQVRKFQKLA
ncbi:MAG: oligosaccharide flippase family protein [Cyclobacteriaceae bacterium]